MSANATGPAPAATATAAAPSARRAARGAVTRITTPVLAATRAKLTSHTPPTDASASIAGCCHWLAPSSAHGPPSACQDRIHSTSSQKLGTTTSAARLRPAVIGGRSRAQALTPTPAQQTPRTMATSSRAGPMLGSSQ